MTAMLWILLPLFIAAGSALLSFYIMQAKLEVAVAKERECLAEANATIRNQELMIVEKVKSAEESTMRKSFDQFLGDFRVEERQYMRENNSVVLNRKSLIMQERLFFRNIPLSNWVEHEMVVEEGTDMKSLAKQCSIFSTRTLPGDERPAASRMLKAQGARTG